MKQHTYTTSIEWTGNNGNGTETYEGYRRDFTVSCSGKHAIAGSSDPNFRGDPERYNPEELLVASLASCHMLWYLHLCSSNEISVVSYNDQARGTMQMNSDGSGAFTRVLLQPVVTVAAGEDVVRALELHTEAHRFCFIARSMNFPTDHAPEILEQIG
ncbi:MAG: OsmC family protein [Acidobacteriota bacterium]|nr:OsmC family protein [Acidobacteriota bacterium]